MEKIRYRRPFAKELRIRRHTKRKAAVARIRRERPAQFQSRARRHRALLDDQLRRSRFRRNLSRNVVDGGKVRIAVLFGRSAHANKNSIALAYRFTRV